MQLNAKCITLSVSLLSGTIATAGTMGTVNAPYFGELGFSAGYFKANQGKTQHINIQGLVGNTYTTDRSNDGNYLLGLGYLINGGDYNYINMSYGLKAFYLAKTDVSGVIFQEDFFDNLSYKYSITQVPVYAMARAMTNPFNSRYALTLDGGIGLNVLHTSNYKEYSLDNGITLLDHAFYGKTKTVFSATGGIGVRINNVIDSLALELGYRFFYLGQGYLNQRTSQILDHLKTGNSYANAIVVTASSSNY